MKTPNTMSAIARINSPVKTNFGARRTTSPSHPRGSARPLGAGAVMRPAPSHLGSDNLFPHFGELRLVGGPHLLFGDLAEGANIGGVDRHPLGLQQLLGLGEVVDAFG